MPPRLSVVVPCFNEAATISQTITTIHQYLERQTITHEIIVADDGSRDGTAGRAARTFQSAEWLRVIRLQHGGKGRAVQKGAFRSRGDLILMSDADLATPMDELPAFLEAVDDGADVIIASRDLPKSVLVVPQSLHRRLVGKLFRLFIQSLFQLPIADTQCGFKLFTRRAALAIFPRQKTLGFTFDVEVLYWAKILGFKTVELPVHWINRLSSRVSLARDFFPIIRELVLLRIQFHKNLKGAK